MRRRLQDLYHFLPVQLVLLHLRKYQLLLLFWAIISLTITGNFAAHFGASTLFLAPEYLGEISFTSMLLLGGAMGVFLMAWHITTFIIHSHRVPFLGATRQAFLKYCINNSLIPLVFFIFYTIITVRFQYFNEHTDPLRILLLQLGFYLGFLLVIMLSFAYFFRVGRDLLKVVLSSITNPAIIREIIPYDTLDYDYDLVPARTYLSETLRVEQIRELKNYHPRLLNTVLRRHHRNAITATVFAFTLLILLGIFMEEPLLRIPAGAGFLILFAVMMGLLGAIKYFLRSWEFIGWGLLLLLLSVLVSYRVFDLRSIAYGMDYHTAEADKPEYDHSALRRIFTPQRFMMDKLQGQQNLQRWKERQMATTDSLPPLVIVSVSGGGSRSAYWTFRCLQYADSLTGGKLFKHTVLMTGASGGMLGAAYWRSIHQAGQQGLIRNPYDPKYQENVGKDLLNAIVFSLASVDIISPFNKISIAGYSYTRDRGYAMEQELIRNTEGMLDRKLGDFKQAEAEGLIPTMIIGSTIMNDGRKLLMSAQPVSYLTQPEYSLRDSIFPKPIDGVDFATLFEKQNPYNLRLTTALRMNATFPLVLPVVKMPSRPEINLMDVGLRDNFGVEVATRYLHVFRDWIANNTRRVIYLQIRDTREYEVFPLSHQNTLGRMLADPIFIIQNKWEPFQSYVQGYLKDFAPWFLDGKLDFVTLQYIPEEEDQLAALNFHLTEREKQDLYRSVQDAENQAAIRALIKLME